MSSQKYSPGINFGQLESLHLNSYVKQMILQDTKINDLNRQLPKIYLFANVTYFLLLQIFKTMEKFEFHELIMLCFLMVKNTIQAKQWLGECYLNSAPSEIMVKTS